MRKRLLITAYHYDSAYSMESRLTWQRAQRAAEEYDVTVLCAEASWPTPRGATEAPVTTVELPRSPLERRLMGTSAGYYIGYARWQRRLFRRAAELHAANPFDLVHHVSFCGYREPGYCWRLGIPFVWGPVGGASQFPAVFLREIGPVAAAKEIIRNAANRLQLLFGRRVRRAARASAAMLAANRETAAALRNCLGGPPQVQLETGIETVRSAPRPPRDADQSLRILWAGRLRPWKGLPLLLKGLSDLPADCRWTLRVLGEGPCERSWRTLAHRLGIADRVEWAGWSPPLADQLPHYDWAEVFAFTSLRDTSGTGLLEALAAGAPIVGLDHQGAADVMTDDSAIRIPVVSPRQTVAAIRDAIARLAANTDELARLSAGAIQRAQAFTWQSQWESTRTIYSTATGAAVAEARRPTSQSPATVQAVARTHAVPC